MNRNRAEQSKSTQTQPSRGETLASEMEVIMMDFNMAMKEERKVRNENILKALIKNMIIIRYWISKKQP